MDTVHPPARGLASIAFVVFLLLCFVGGGYRNNEKKSYLENIGFINSSSRPSVTRCILKWH